MRWRAGDTMAFNAVTKTGEMLRNAWDKKEAGDAYASGSEVTNPEDASVIEAYRDAATEQAGPTGEYDSYDFLPGGLGAKQPDQEQRTAAANSFSNAANIGTKYHIGRGDGNQGTAYKDAPTQPQKHASGLRRQMEHFSAAGNIDEAGKLSERLQSMTRGDQQEELNRRVLAEHDIKIAESKKQDEFKAKFGEMQGSYAAGQKAIMEGRFDAPELRPMFESYNKQGSGWGDDGKTGKVVGNTVIFTDKDGKEQAPVPFTQKDALSAWNSYKQHELDSLYRQHDPVKSYERDLTNTQKLREEAIKAAGEDRKDRREAERQDRTDNRFFGALGMRGMDGVGGAGGSRGSVGTRATSSNTDDGFGLSRLGIKDQKEATGYIDSILDKVAQQEPIIGADGKTPVDKSTARVEIGRQMAQLAKFNPDITDADSAMAPALKIARASLSGNPLPTAPVMKNGVWREGISIDGQNLLVSGNQFSDDQAAIAMAGPNAKPEVLAKAKEFVNDKRNDFWMTEARMYKALDANLAKDPTGRALEQYLQAKNMTRKDYEKQRDDAIGRGESLEIDANERNERIREYMKGGSANQSQNTTTTDTQQPKGALARARQFKEGFDGDLTVANRSRPMIEAKIRNGYPLTSGEAEIAKQLGISVK